VPITIGPLPLALPLPLLAELPPDGAELPPQPARTVAAAAATAMLRNGTRCW